MKSLHAAIAGALTLLFGFVSPTLAANGLVRDGIGAITGGRAGTNLGHFDNGALLLDNPAGIVNMQGNGFIELGIDTVFTDIDYADPENRVSNRLKPFPTPEGSYIRKAANGRVAYGVGFFLPAGFSAEYMMTNPILGRQKYFSLGVLGKILPGVAVQVNDQLSVGGTVGLGISHLELEGPFFGQTGLLMGVPAMFDLTANGAAFVWSLGMQYKITPNTVFGAAYISEADFDLDGSLGADITLGPGVTVPTRFDADVGITWPRSFGAGITHVHDRHRFSADIVWIDWSDAFDRIDFRLKNALSPVPGFAGLSLTEQFPLNWRDAVTYRFGYEFFRCNCDVIRLGYSHHRSPTPDPTLTPYTDGVLEHTFSVGYSRFLGDWTFDAAYQYGFGRSRTVANSQIVGGDFNNSRFRAQVHWLMLTLSRRL